MRMRKMKNLDVRMERCAALRIAEPATLKGNWRSLKPDATALWVEVGCGKGKFTAETNPKVRWRENSTNGRGRSGEIQHRVGGILPAFCV